jgi:hypothetical protein
MVFSKSLDKTKAFERIHLHCTTPAPDAGARERTIPRGGIGCKCDAKARIYPFGHDVANVQAYLRHSPICAIRVEKIWTLPHEVNSLKTVKRNVW